MLHKELPLYYFSTLFTKEKREKYDQERKQVSEVLSDWLKEITLTRHVGIQTSQQVLESELLASHGPLLCLPPSPLSERK